MVLLSYFGEIDRERYQGFTVEVTFEQRQSNETRHMKSTSGRVESKGKGLGVRISWVHSRNRKQIDVNRVKGIR